MAVTTAANPLRAGFRLSRVPSPGVLVIFGGTGDLTSRKLMPALYDLARQRLLPAAFAVVGTGRGQLTDAEYRAQAHEAVAAHSRSRPIDEEIWRTVSEAQHWAGPDATVPEYLDELAGALAHRIVIKERRNRSRDPRS